MIGGHAPAPVGDGGGVGGGTPNANDTSSRPTSGRPALRNPDADAAAADASAEEKKADEQQAAGSKQRPSLMRRRPCLQTTGGRQGSSRSNLLNVSGRSLGSGGTAGTSGGSASSSGRRPGLVRGGSSRRLVTSVKSKSSRRLVVDGATPKKSDSSKAPSRRDLLSSVASTRSAKLMGKIRFSLAESLDSDDDDDDSSETSLLSLGGPGDGDASPPDLHHACETCSSLSELRDALQRCTEEAGNGSGSGRLGQASNPCAEPRHSDGKLPLHCVGLNRNLILGAASGGTPSSVHRIDQFIIRDLIAAYPVSVVEEDDYGRIPFTEVIIDWIEARRAVRLMEGAFKSERRRKARVSKAVSDFASSLVQRVKRLSDLVCDDEEEDDDDNYYYQGQDLAGYAVLNDEREEEEEERVKEETKQMEMSEDSRRKYDRARKRLSELSDEEIEYDDEEDEEQEVHDLPALVEWSLRLLSNVIDQSQTGNQLGCAGSQKEMQRSSSDPAAMMDDDEDRRDSVSSKNTSMNLGALYSEVIVEKMAEIPHLVQELLLIEDKSARARVFDLSIVHKVLFCHESLGDGKWLIDMMDRGIRSGQAGGGVTSKEEQVENCAYAEGAVFYLENISSLNLQDDLHFSAAVRRTSATRDMISGSDVRHYRKKRARLFEVVGGVSGIIRTLCVLEGNLVSRVAVTACIQHALDRKIFSPFSMTVALSDGLFHLLLIVSFRLGPARHLFHLSPDDPFFRPHQYLISNMVLMICVVYFGLKETQLAFAKYHLSRRLFWSDLFSFWTVLDIVPLILVSLCSIAVDFTIRGRVLQSSLEDDGSGSFLLSECARNTADDGTIPFQLRVLVASVTPFLWLRVLGHVKMWNKQLATFVLCSVEIMKDIKWFLLVLFVAMASFAQMFVSLTCEAKGDGDHYTNFSIEGYVKAYTIMLGDIDSLSIENHPVITLLFILYTFGVTIVLLNVLIAIVSESYSRSIVSSNLMLGKARLMFVAEMSSLKNFQELYKTGQTGHIRRNAVIISIAYGLFITKRIDGTTQVKLDFLGRTCATGLLGFSRLDIEAAVVFLFLAAFVLAVRMLMTHIHNTFDNNRGVVAESEEKGKRSAWVRMADSCIERFIVFVRRNLDTLSDGDDRELIEGATGVSSAGSASHANGAGMKKIYQALAANKKAVKIEMMNTSDDVRHALQDTEDHLQMDMTKMEVRLDASLTENEERVTESVAAMIAASEERILSAMMAQLNKGGN